MRTNVRSKGLGLVGLVISLTVLTGLSASAAHPDYYNVTGANPKLETASSFRDLNFGPEEFTADGTQSVVQPHAADSNVFSPDGHWLWVQTARIGTPQQGGGVLQHISQFDPATGLKTTDIPVDTRWPHNPLTPVLAQWNLKADTADLMAATNKNLAVLVRAGYEPKRWLPALYDTTGKLVKTLPLLSGTANSEPVNLLFSDDGRYLVFEHSLPHSLYTLEIATGKVDKTNLDLVLDQAGLVPVHSPLFALPGGQLAFFAASKSKKQKRIVIFDLDASAITSVLGDSLELDNNLEQEATLDTRGKMLIAPARALNDKDNASRCAGGGPCLRLYKFPELSEMLRFKVKTAAGAPIMEYFDAHNQRMALSEADSRLLIVGSNSVAKTDYAMLLDTLANGNILSWVKLPVRPDAWLRIGPRHEGGYWVLGEQPKPGLGLRLFRF